MCIYFKESVNTCIGIYAGKCSAERNTRSEKQRPLGYLSSSRNSEGDNSVGAEIRESFKEFGFGG